MTLYRKYRPQSFDEVKGNKSIINPLKKIIEKKETQVFLFHGAYGSGKTTLARICAKELGCSENNIHEIDTAQFRGIDTARELKQKTQYNTLDGGSRAYIMDEIHKATGDAQNGLLKLFEDTPPKTYFFLCTTDPQTLLPTIKSRCSQFQVQTLSDEDMEDLIIEIAEKEGEIDFGSRNGEVLTQIIIDSQGHPRDAINILEQVLAVPKKQRLKIARQSAVQQSQSIELCRVLIQGKGWKAVSEVLRGLKGQDAESIRRVVLGYATSVLLNKMDANAGIILECFEEPTYNIGFPGIVLACVRVVNYGKN